MGSHRKVELSFRPLLPVALAFAAGIFVGHVCMAKSVSLWASSIPFISLIADHHWLVVEDEERVTRWEVWQTANAITNDIGESWGHLHRDLMEPEKGVGGGRPSHKLDAWHGDAAVSLMERIYSSPRQYPWCGLYRYWPGPNSNTYVQWVLSGTCKLSRRGLGRHYGRLALIGESQWRAPHSTFEGPISEGRHLCGLRPLGAE